MISIIVTIVFLIACSWLLGKFFSRNIDMSKQPRAQANSFSDFEKDAIANCCGQWMADQVNKIPRDTLLRTSETKRSELVGYFRDITRQKLEINSPSHDIYRDARNNGLGNVLMIGEQNNSHPMYCDIIRHLPMFRITITQSPKRVVVQENNCQPVVIYPNK